MITPQFLQFWYVKPCRISIINSIGSSKQVARIPVFCSPPGCFVVSRTHGFVPIC